MKTLLTFLTILVWGTNGFCQKDSLYQMNVAYKMRLNFNGFRFYKAELRFNRFQSVFVYKEVSENANPSQKIAERRSESADEMAFNISLKDTNSYYITSDKEKNEIFEWVDLFRKTYLVKEVFPSIDWKIESEIKKINAHECMKATGKFGGRNYTAWFTTDVQTSLGPLKLHGLPGLILELADDTQEVELFVSEIRVEQTPLAHLNPRLPVLTHAEYRKKLNEGFDEMSRQISSKMGRDVTVKVTMGSFKSIELE
ncbi:MAG: GLPGLI family protein [Marinilabiliales bacterium]|nr:GLPGLI family protein [Marinilabiliales bacterium]